MSKNLHNFSVLRTWNLQFSEQHKILFLKIRNIISVILTCLKIIFAKKTNPEISFPNAALSLYNYNDYFKSTT